MGLLYPASNVSGVRLRPAAIDFKSLRLTPEEGYVLSRLEGPTDVDQVAAVTGLPEARVRQIVAHLIEVGALEEEKEGSPSMIPSVPPGAAGSTAPPAMMPSAVALPNLGAASVPRELRAERWSSSRPPRGSFEEGEGGLPPGVTALEPTEELPPGVEPIEELPFGVEPIEGLPPGVEAIEELPPGVRANQARNPFDDDLDPLGDLATTLRPARQALDGGWEPPTQASARGASVRPKASAPPRIAVRDVVPPASQASARAAIREEVSSQAPARGFVREEVVGSSSRPPTRPSRRVPTHVSAAPRRHPTEAGELPEGLLPEFGEERRLPPGVPDIFCSIRGDPKGRAAPSSTPGAAFPGEVDDAKGLSDPSRLALAENEGRRLYVAQYRERSLAERLEAAERAEDPDLSALCFDPEPPVIAQLLQNPHVGLSHARLIALHHRTAAGLEMLLRHGDLLRDGMVQRGLLRNPQLPDSLFGRVLKTKRLADLFRACTDRDFPERTRTRLNRELRVRFGTSSPDEKAELVYRTEGRVLHFLSGCTFDGKTTQILCSRTYNSAIIIQNLARFSATPPALLAKVVQQPFVSRQPGLKQLLLRHPNMPGEIKRRV